MKNPKIKLVLALLVMFVLGAVSGASVGWFCEPCFGGPPQEKDMGDHLLAFLTHRLHLTPDEQVKIKPITADFGRKAVALHDQALLNFNQLADATDAQIIPLITPEQKAELDKVHQERNQMLQNHEGPFLGPGPGGPGGSDGSGGPPGSPPDR
jgi:hypothetical protein